MKMTNVHPFRWISPFGHWEEEFAHYKTYDEYKLYVIAIPFIKIQRFIFRLTPEDREALTLDNFKLKWSLVYGHRMGGRMLFFAFFGPCIYFWKKGYFNSILKKRMFLLAF